MRDSIFPRAIKITLLIAFLCSSILNAATTRYVKFGGAGSKTGLDWSNASPDLQTMINASADGDAIYMASGTYSLNTVVWNKAVNIYGGFNSASPESNISNRVMSDNLTISGGSTSFAWDFKYPTIISHTGNGRVLNTSGFTQIAYFDGF